jgi:hypothetical protein
MCHSYGFLQMPLESGSVRQARERIRPTRRQESISLFPEAISESLQACEHGDRRWLGQDEAKVIRVDPSATDLLVHEVQEPGVTDCLSGHRNADGSISRNVQRAPTKLGERLLHEPPVAMRQESVTPHATQKRIRYVLNAIMTPDAQTDFDVVAGWADLACL